MAERLKLSQDDVNELGGSIPPTQARWRCGSRSFPMFLICSRAFMPDGNGIGSVLSVMNKSEKSNLENSKGDGPGNPYWGMQIHDGVMML